MEKRIDCNLTLNYANEKARICDMMSCSNCPLGGVHGCDTITQENIKIVQAWSDENPDNTIMAGDRVRIIDVNRLYESYANFMKKYGTEEEKLYQRSGQPIIESDIIYRVHSVNVHPDYPDKQIAIIACDGSLQAGVALQVFMMGTEGLEKV